MATVHWLGAGLSTRPGIQRLANSAHQLVVWNRTIAKAQQAIARSVGERQGRATAAKFDTEALSSRVQAGDVVVSMLPGDWHVRLAEIALQNRAHFISSSYISPEMKALDSQFREAGLVNINEVGLDPGIDHLFAHSLVNDYKASEACRADNQVFFRSYCGGVPAIPNDFTYKFSWSPLGVLKALRSRAQWIESGEVRAIDTPWKAATDYNARVANNEFEMFEAYANRDSLPFMRDYNFDPAWDIHEFVRGTLRLNGWSQAWQPIFDEIETLEGKKGETRLQAISDQLWDEYQYDVDDPDRVVLCVEFEARDPWSRQPVWHQSYNLDAIGAAEETAMAKLVSFTVSLAVDSVLHGEIAPGVTPAPSSMAVVNHWLKELRNAGANYSHDDHLSG